MYTFLYAYVPAGKAVCRCVVHALMEMGYTDRVAVEKAAAEVGEGRAFSHAS
jgi:hypothetical protein